jgi:ketosteroid isomerase-like protein
MSLKIIFITMLATFALPSFGDQPTKSEGEMNIAKAEQFIENVLVEPDVAKSLLHDDFDFVFMGRSQISNVPYDKDTFFSVWIAEVVAPLVPGGFTRFEVVDAIGDSDGVALMVEGDAEAINGRYDNKYVMVFKFEEGKIRSFREYSSDLLAATRLFEQKLVADE